MDKETAIKTIIYDLALEFGFGKFSPNIDDIDYKFWEDVPAKDIAHALAEKIVKLKSNIK